MPYDARKSIPVWYRDQEPYAPKGAPMTAPGTGEAARRLPPDDEEEADDDDELERNRDALLVPVDLLGVP